MQLNGGREVHRLGKLKKFNPLDTRVMSEMLFKAWTFCQTQFKFAFFNNMMNSSVLVFSPPCYFAMALIQRLAKFDE